jgi:spore maturation protein CgeB
LVLRDRDLTSALIETGLRTIRERHTCAHRVRELLGIVESLNPRGLREPRAGDVEAEGVSP